MNEQNDAWIATQADQAADDEYEKRKSFNEWYCSADEGEVTEVYMAWSAWQASGERNNQVVDDLAALVSRLARALNKAAPKHTLPALVMDYLKRKDLLTNPMRSKFLGDSVDAAYDTFQAAVSQPDDTDYTPPDPVRHS